MGNSLNQLQTNYGQWQKEEFIQTESWGNLIWFLIICIQKLNHETCLIWWYSESETFHVNNIPIRHFIGGGMMVAPALPGIISSSCPVQQFMGHGIPSHMISWRLRSYSGYPIPSNHILVSSSLLVGLMEAFKYNSKNHQSSLSQFCQ